MKLMSKLFEDMGVASCSVKDLVDKEDYTDDIWEFLFESHAYKHSSKSEYILDLGDQGIDSIKDIRIWFVLAKLSPALQISGNSTTL